MTSYNPRGTFLIVANIARQFIALGRSEEFADFVSANRTIFPTPDFKATVEKWDDPSDYGYDELYHEPVLAFAWVAKALDLLGQSLEIYPMQHESVAQKATWKPWTWKKWNLQFRVDVKSPIILQPIDLVLWERFLPSFQFRKGVLSDEADEYWEAWAKVRFMRPGKVVDEKYFQILREARDQAAIVLKLGAIMQNRSESGAVISPVESSESDEEAAAQPATETPAQEQVAADFTLSLLRFASSDVPPPAPVPVQETASEDAIIAELAQESLGIGPAQDEIKRPGTLLHDSAQPVESDVPVAAPVVQETVLLDQAPVVQETAPMAPEPVLQETASLDQQLVAQEEPAPVEPQPVPQEAGLSEPVPVVHETGSRESIRADEAREMAEPAPVAPPVAEPSTGPQEVREPRTSFLAITSLLAASDSMSPPATAADPVTEQDPMEVDPPVLAPEVRPDPLPATGRARKRKLDVISVGSHESSASSVFKRPKVEGLLGKDILDSLIDVMSDETVFSILNISDARLLEVTALGFSMNNLQSLMNKLHELLRKYGRLVKILSAWQSRIIAFQQMTGNADAAPSANPIMPNESVPILFLMFLREMTESVEGIRTLWPTHSSIVFEGCDSAAMKEHLDSMTMGQFADFTTRLRRLDVLIESVKIRFKPLSSLMTATMTLAVRHVYSKNVEIAGQLKTMGHMISGLQNGFANV